MVISILKYYSATCSFYIFFYTKPTKEAAGKKSCGNIFMEKVPRFKQLLPSSDSPPDGRTAAG